MEVVGRSIYIFLYEHQYFYVNINIAKKWSMIIIFSNNLITSLVFLDCLLLLPSHNIS
jgi:hypothetical protein